MKKMIALLFAGLMIFSMPVMAKEANANPPYANYPEDTALIEPASIVVAAIEEDKTVGEYMNNAVTAAWALAEVVPVGQGGKVILDGVETNQTFSVLEPEYGHVGSALQYVRNYVPGGEVLNVVKIDSSAAYFSVANVNFYLPSITADENVHVYQYVNYDTWTELNVTEVRADHVVVDMTTPKGFLAFVKQP